MKVLLAVIIMLLLSVLACTESGAIRVQEIPPTPIATPTPPPPTPVSLRPESPIAGNLQFAPSQERSFQVVVSEPGFLLVQLQWTVTGNGLEVFVEVADTDPAFLQRLQTAGLPTLLLKAELLEPQGDLSVPIASEYVNHAIRVRLRNATPSNTQSFFSATFERMAIAQAATPTPSPLPTMTTTSTSTPAPTATPAVTPTTPPTLTTTPLPTATATAAPATTATPTQTATRTPAPPSAFTLAIEIRPADAANLGAVVNGAGKYTPGRQVRISASPETKCDGNTNYVFDGWEGVDGSPTGNPLNVLMSSDKKVVAVYAKVVNSPTCAAAPTPTDTPAPVDTPTVTPTPTFTPVPVDPTAEFVGNWVNTDTNTGGMTRLIIEKVNDTTVSFHGFGACSPTDCDWGAINVRFTPPKLVGTYDFGFKTTQIVAIRSGDKLLADNLDRDPSGVPLRSNSYVMQRQSIIKLTPTLVPTITITR